MLSDEEKKEYIEHEILDRLYCLEENDFDKNKVDDGYIKAVLNACKEAKNLIEKQSKEIEELKEYKHDAELTKVACCTAQNCEALNNCIKLERELQNADKVWEDKIKAKIEELENQKRQWIEDRDNKHKDSEIIYAIEVLQSLLEKE